MRTWIRRVELTDFTYLAASFNGSPTPWTHGDFNYDGKTDLTDFTYLASNFNQPLPAAPLPLAPVAVRAMAPSVSLFSTVPLANAMSDQGMS
jgi:hypothetical protein